MIDDQGNQVKTAPPSTPVNILGWSGVPVAGAVFKRSKNEREARREVDEYSQLSKEVEVVAEEDDEGMIHQEWMLFLQQFQRVRQPLTR